MKVASKIAAVIATGVVVAILLWAQPMNAQPTNLLTLSAWTPSATPTNGGLPIELTDVPLDVAIQALAREADINYLIDPRVEQWWHRSVTDGGEDQTPIVNLREMNVTPQEVLEQILHEHHLVLLEDPPTGIARITYPKQTIQPLDPELYGVLTNKAAQIQPNIQFTDVPLDVCLQAMARDAGINYLLDPMVGYGTPDKYGIIQQPPTSTFRWDHVTAAQGFYALCENYGFTVERDPNSHIVFLRTKDHPITLFTDANFLAGDTNNIVPNTNVVNQETLPIQFTDVPLDVCLQALAREARINYLLDPRMGWGLPDKDGFTRQPPIVTCRWQNVTAAQGFVALCEHYGLVIYKIPRIGFYFVGPMDKQITHFVDASLLGSDTNTFVPIQIQGSIIRQGSACSNTNMIEIDSTPLQTALNELAGCAQIKIPLDTDLPDLPPISIGLVNVSPKMAIVALCDIFDLTITKDPTSGEIEISPQLPHKNGVPLVPNGGNG